MTCTVGSLVRHFEHLAAEAATASVSDRDLLLRFRNTRDEAAFTALLLRHGSMVYHTCRRTLTDEQDAEDAWQQTFLLLVARAGVGRWQNSLAGWLHETARRIALKTRALTIRRQVREKRHSRQSPRILLDEITGRELHTALDDELARLPTRVKVPLVLCYLEGLTRDEAARRLGCPLSTLKLRVQQGRDLLQKRLQKRGLALSAALATATLITNSSRAALPATRIHATLEAALQLAGKPLTGAVISANTLSLARRVLKTLLLTKPKLTATILAIGLCAAGAGLLALPKVSEVSLDDRPTSVAAQKPLPPEKEKLREAVDQFGDALPQDAIVRIGRIRWRVDGHAPEALAVSPDGKTLVAVHPADGITVFDTKTGKSIRRIPDKPELGKKWLGMAFWSVSALSADGRKAALIPDKRGIHLIDVATGEETGKEFKPAGLISRAVLSGDGGILATWSDHGLVQVWDAANGKLLNELPTVRKQDARWSPLWLALSADGKTLAWVGEDGACPIHIVDVTTGKELHKLEDHDGGARQVVLAPNGAYLVASSSTGLVQLWDLKQGSVLHKWKGRQSNHPLPLAVFTPDGKKIVLNEPCDCNAIRLIDIATGKDQWSIDSNRWMSPVPDAYSISPDGKILFRVWGGGSVVYRFEMETGKQILLPGEMSHAFRDVAFAADDATLFSSSEIGVVRAWEVTTGKETRQVLSRPVGMFSPDGGLMVKDTGLVFELLEIATNNVRLRGEGSQVFSLDSRMVAALGKKSIAILDTATGKPISKLPCPDAKPYNVRFTPDGQRLAVLAETAEGFVLRFWECGTGQELPSKPMPVCDYVTLLFSPDGRTVVVGAHPDKSPPGLLVVETATGQQRQYIRFDKMPGLRIWPPNVAFTPGGECLLIGDGAAGVSVVDPLTGELLHRRQANGGNVFRMVFSPSGRFLATVGGDTTILVWNAFDFLRPARPKPLKLLEAELSSLWDDLASADAPKAALAMRQLTRAGDQALNLLRERLPPATAVTVDAKRLKQWLDDLDDESFETRQRAEAEIEKLGEAARPALQKAADGQLSLHVRRTIDRLKAKIDPRQLMRPARSVEVLEFIGTPAARDLLEKLAKGAPEARLTIEAQASLARLLNKGK